LAKPPEAATWEIGVQVSTETACGNSQDHLIAMRRKTKFSGKGAAKMSLQHDPAACEVCDGNAFVPVIAEFNLMYERQYKMG